MSARPVTPFVRRVTLAVMAVLAAVVLPSGQIRPLTPSAASPADPYPNFDIRTYKDDPALAGSDALAAYMAATAPAAVAADALAGSRNGLAALRAELPGVRVEEGLVGGASIVSAMPGTPFLSEAGGDRVAALRGFLQGHAEAFGLSGDQANALVVVADEMNPAGNMAWVELEQRIHGIPVFQGHLRGAFTAKGELARTNGLLATGADGVAAQSASLSSAQAAAIAAANVQLPADAGEKARTWQTYFPLAPGVVRLAWVAEVLTENAGYMSVVDAATGTVLFRKSTMDSQTQTATYNVYTTDSPAPASPSPALPGANYVPPMAARSNIVVVGNEGTSSFNNLGWITDGNNTTDGNNVEAGIDRDGTNGVDLPLITGSPNRVFTATYNPPPGNPAPGDDPLTAQAQRGEIINMFYWVNRYHDDTYRLGFTEAFRNFQNDNFGRGGAGADRVSAETQDSSGTNNANFNTPADGGRGRMQMFLWTGPTPDHGGGLDADVVIHELTHGLSNRLHANASGLSTNMAAGMGEGWSDFYARALLADASENVAGIYTTGGWATKNLGANFESYYYGIRKFPYAVKTTVGTNGLPHNPMTFADIDSTQSNFTDGAHVPNPVIGVGSARDQVHEMGQIWAMMLLEVRARFITRLGFATGNQRILQFVTDGMKGDPVGPTFLQARDSIIAAANAGGGTADDIADIWAGFAARGLGTLASIQNAGTGGNTTRVTESYLRPGDPTPSFTINDVSATEGNAGTKTFAFTVTLTNPSGPTATVAYTTAPGTATASVVESTFTSAGPATIPDVGNATIYPMNVTVSGLTGTVSTLAVRLNSLSHTFPGDIDVLVVAPTGQKMIVQSDMGGTGDVSGLTYTIADSGAALLSSTQLTAGTFRPSNSGAADPFGAPAPAGPYAEPTPAGSATLNGTFGGINPNGTWSVYIVDDVSQDAGSIGSVSLVVGVPATTTDYVNASGVLSFPSGTTTQVVNVTDNGDTTPEPDESFFVNLSTPVNGTIGDAQGMGTIINDDGGTFPTATNDAYSVALNTPLNVAAPGVLGNDNANGLGALTAALVTPPSNGGVTLSGNGSFVYTPNTGFSGSDSFTYRAQAGAALSNTATVALTVSAVTTIQPPTNFYVSSVVGNRVTVRWTPPAAGPTPTGYVFEGGVAPGQVLASLPLGTLPLFTLDAPTGSFFIRMRSVAGASTSGVSNEVPLHVNVPVTPSAPANLLGLVNGSTLSLQWRNTFGGGAPAGAILDVTGAVAASLPLGATETFSFAGVPGGNYTFRVRSSNGGGNSPQSNSVALTFPSACTGAPQVPTQFLAYRVGNVLNIVWEAPTAGPAASSYVLRATGAVTIDVPMPTTSISVPVPPGTYNLSVRSANACGGSAFTAVQSVTIP